MLHHIIARSILDDMTNSTCPEVNTEAINTASFFAEGWSWSVIGWAVAGGCTLVTCIVTIINVYRHCTSYWKPLEQRQVVRLLITPAFFAIMSFLSYYFFRHAIYFELIRDAYQGLAIAAFMVLILTYLSNSPVEQREVLAQKEKRKLVFPFCCWRFRPSKPYFLWTVKWSVMQYAIVKPLLSVVAIILEAFHVYCSISWSFMFGAVYIFIVDFISMSVALYGLFVLYVLIKAELLGHRPLAKFTTIKIVVALLFYQGFVFSLLASYGYLPDTTYWTSTNVQDGFNALVLCIEMVLIALFQLYAFPVSEYRLIMLDDRPNKRTPFWSSFFHSQNYGDFAVDIWLTMRFYWDAMRGKDYTRATKEYTDQVKLLGGNNFDLDLGANDLATKDRSYVPKDEDEDEYRDSYGELASYPPSGQMRYGRYSEEENVGTYELSRTETKSGVEGAGSGGYAK